MLAMTNRNLKIYFNNKASVFFSLLGTMIAFGLYLLFLQKNMSDGLSRLPDSEVILDNWLMGGSIALAGMTTTWSVVSQLAADKETHKLDDLLLTDSTFFRLNMGYLLSASLVGFVMQTITFSFMSLYFYTQHGLSLELSRLPSLLFIMVLNAVLHSALGLSALQFIKTLVVVERLSVIIGTISGFLIGLYMPIGAFPDFAQTITKLTPGAYVAAAFRQVLLTGHLTDSSLGGLDLKAYLGVGLKLGDLINLRETIVILIGFILVSLLLLAILVAVKGRKKLRGNKQIDLKL